MRVLGCLLLLGLSGCRDCLRYEDRVVHHPMWVQHVSIGGGQYVSIIHPAHDSTVAHCVEYAPEADANGD